MGKRWGNQRGAGSRGGGEGRKVADFDSAEILVDPLHVSEIAHAHGTRELPGPACALARSSFFPSLAMRSPPPTRFRPKEENKGALHRGPAWFFALS